MAREKKLDTPSGPQPSWEEMVAELTRKDPDFIGTPDGHIVPWTEAWRGPMEIYSTRVDDLAFRSADAPDKDLLARSFVRMAFGRLAQKRAQRAEIYDLGGLLVTNHFELNRMAQSVFRIKLPAEFDVEPKKLQAFKKLSKLSGSRFDSAFLNFLIADHKQEISRVAVIDSLLCMLLADEILSALKRQLAIAEFLRKLRVGRSKVLH